MLLSCLMVLVLEVHWLIRVMLWVVLWVEMWAVLRVVLGVVLLVVCSSSEDVLHRHLHSAWVWVRMSGLLRLLIAGKQVGGLEWPKVNIVGVQTLHLRPNILIQLHGLGRLVAGDGSTPPQAHQTLPVVWWRAI